MDLGAWGYSHCSLIFSGQVYRGKNRIIKFIDRGPYFINYEEIEFEKNLARTCLTLRTDRARILRAALAVY